MAKGSCAHYGHCGGCSLHEMDEASYLQWKRALVADAFRSVGVEADVAPCIEAHGRGRRRATLHARRGADGVLKVGFSAPRSHEIVDLSASSCPLFAPGLECVVEIVRALAEALRGVKKPLDAVVTTTITGLDVDLRGAGKISEDLRLKLAGLAERHDLARLALHGDVVVERRAPVLLFGRMEVSPPPGAFLQATEAGEAHLNALVREAIGLAKRAADLFAGSGTFAARIAEHASVHAVENEARALAAFDKAWRRAAGLKAVSVELRDLFRRPLTTAELARFDAVVFDPPRAGAEAQARQLAQSKVKRVAAVSCNPVTLAKDVRTLLGGGYKLKRVVPVDQFRHSQHVEAVAMLER